MTLADEIYTFCETLQLAPIELNETHSGGIALSEIADFFIDAGADNCVCLYILDQRTDFSEQELLQGLALCHPTRNLGPQLNFIADPSGRVGFLVILQKSEPTANELSQYFDVLLRTYLKFISTM